MASICKWITAASLALLLIACGREDSETPPLTETGSAADAHSAPLRAEPGSAPPPIDHDAAAIEEPAAAGQARTDRQRLREQRGPAGHWWDDPVLITGLDLTDEQRTALAQAQQSLHAARVEARSRLQDLRIALRATETTEQRDRQEPGRQGRAAIEDQLDVAHQHWQRAVREILDAEQLERLFEQNPAALDRPDAGGA